MQILKIIDLISFNQKSLNRKPLVNKVANKAIMQIDLESYIPKATNIVAFDIKGFLFKELLLKEKDFREQLSLYDFSNLKGKEVYVFCSSKAIIPLWAYLLLATHIKPIAENVVFATNIEEAKEKFVEEYIKKIDFNVYKDKRVIIKGCSNSKFSTNLYVFIVKNIQEKAKAIMFGEACSMLPIYKK